MNRPNKTMNIACMNTACVLCEGAHVSMNDKVVLKITNAAKTKDIHSVTDCIEAAATELVSELEAEVLVWCKQIEQVTIAHTDNDKDNYFYICFCQQNIMN